MPVLSLVGPSYNLRSKNTDCERTINWMPVLNESGQGRAGSYLKQCDGLSLLGNIGGALRGMWVSRGELYAVAGDTLYHVPSTWAEVSKGTLLSASGRVGMADNETQLCVVDGASGYVLDLDTDDFQVLGSPFRGSNRVDVLDGYGIFVEPGTSQFYLTGAQDFTSLDALDFATAEGATGEIRGHIVKHREVLLLKTKTGEVWVDAGGQDFPLSRQEGANIEVGLLAEHTLQKIGGSAFWLGCDDKGEKVVLTLEGYSPRRVSSHALEEALSGLGDVSDAYAFTYHKEGLTFYVLQVPGLSTTWVYEVASGIWHERADFEDGAYVPWRATCHAVAYGKHIVGDADGNLYELTHTAKANDTDPLVRDRITSSNAMPTLERMRFGSLQVDCDMGEGLSSGFAAKLLLRYSDDGGHHWSNWREIGLGNIGQYNARARATRLGSGRDRVWHFRVTDPVTCNLISAVINEP